MKIERFQVGEFWTNCYVVSNEQKEAVVIDPGGTMKNVTAYIERNGLRLVRVILTHGHGDHIMGLGEIRTLAFEGVCVHAEDADYLVSASKNLSAMMGRASEFKAADSLLPDGGIIQIGGMKIEVIHTPGHTRGSCCFYITEEPDALLISGDTLFARSVGRTDLPGGDEAALIESLKKLESLPDSLAVYPGHGPSTVLGEERKLNPYWPR
ncbi:MAG: MBL fold metallo-hydrolase [Synergistaceae bacterium]|jgi:glyoxylase-like metal-dependent hydrolase (beta-lactamase superfamily II)|nr:MBL fold metallo-hydrolase [Synergistaceae bacterium]